MKVSVAITQMKISGNKEENILKADKLIAEAKNAGAQIILLQELFSDLYFCQIEDYDNFNKAETFNDSSLIKHFQEVAKKHQVVLPISFFEKSGVNYFNSLAMIDADGKILGLYRKMHIPTGQCYEEKFYFTPGDLGYKVFQTKYGKIGVGICWDQWFPEVARILTLKGAELIVYPTAIGSEPVLKRDSMIHWQNTMAGHASANLIPVLASNRVGKEIAKDSSMVFGGYSFIANQHGEVIAQMNREEEGYRLYQFDLAAINQERISWGVFRDRRIDSYHDLLKNGEE